MSRIRIHLRFYGKGRVELEVNRSIEEVTIIDGDFSFQEKLVIGAPVFPGCCTFDLERI